MNNPYYLLHSLLEDLFNKQKKKGRRIEIVIYSDKTGGIYDFDTGNVLFEFDDILEFFQYMNTFTTSNTII